MCKARQVPSGGMEKSYLVKQLQETIELEENAESQDNCSVCTLQPPSKMESTWWTENVECQEILVSWLGYPSTDNTWGPKESLKTDLGDSFSEFYAELTGTGEQ